MAGEKELFVDKNFKVPLIKTTRQPKKVTSRFSGARDLPAERPPRGADLPGGASAGVLSGDPAK